MRDSACRWFILENAEIFESYVKYLWIFPREIWLDESWKLIYINQSRFYNLFHGQDNNTKLVPASFSYFPELL